MTCAINIRMSTMRLYYNNSPKEFCKPKKRLKRDALRVSSAARRIKGRQTTAFHPKIKDCRSRLPRTGPGFFRPGQSKKRPRSLAFMSKKQRPGKERPAEAALENGLRQAATFPAC